MKRYVNLQSLQLGAWIALILIMVLGGYYRLYLVGWQFYTLMFSLVVLGVVTVAGRGAEKCECGHEHAHGCEAEKTTVVETALHFVPLLLFLVIGPTTLGSSGRVSHPMAVTGGEAREVEITAEKTEDGYFKVNLLDLYRIKAFGKEPQPVQVTGMLYFLTKADEEGLPFGVRADEVRTLMFRYAIWCCVADARQVTVVLKGGDFSGLKAGQWLEVKGKALAPKGALPLFTIEVDEARAIEQPGNPYIY